MKKLPALLLLGMLFLNLSCAENTVSAVDKLMHGHWVCSFFNDVLNTQDRDTYYKYAPYYLEHSTKEFSDSHFSDYKIIKWFESDSWKPMQISFTERKEFYNYGKIIKSIVIGQHEYDIEKIDKNKIVLTISEENIKTNKYADIELDIGFEKLEGKKRISLLFEFDGDYVDIYVNNKKNFFATFCKYDITTYNQLKKLIKTNNCEPWRIEYPKRADGSIDYVSGTEHSEDKQ